MIIKKYFFITVFFASLSAFAVDLDKKEVPASGISTTKKILISVAVCGGTGVVVIVFAPAVIPAATLAAMKVAIVAKATTAGVALHGTAVFIEPAVNLVYFPIQGVKYAKSYIFPSKEQKYKKLVLERMEKKPFEERLKEAFEKKK